MTPSRKLFFFLLPILFCTPVKGQLVVDDNYTAQQLVQNVLVGNGVQVSNVTFTGDPIQVGYFDGTNANIPFDEGVVMSTGESPDAVGPNDNGGTSTSLFNNTGDPDLLTIAQQTNTTTETNDVAIIEFDFVPQGDSIDFDFIFGSEEYLEWVGDPYNDVFGFFVSGPGINGPYQNNAENIALIPGTTDPVTISDVNDQQNNMYYVNNGDGNTSPYDTDPQYIQADGHTVALTAEKTVNCGDTYHLKLAIGDGEDNAYDSWVFLEGGSLTSNAITVDTDIDLGQNDSTLWEGCGEASFDILRQGDTTGSDTVYIETSGTAIEGTDYNNLPDSLFYGPGDDSLTISLQAFQDGMNEGQEDASIDIIYKDPSACAMWDTATVDFFINDADTVQLTTSADTAIGACSDSIPIWASATGGQTDYDWTWNQGIPNGDSTGQVGPNTTTTYVVSVSDTCGIGDPTDSITVDVPSYPPLEVHTFNDTDFVCPSQEVPVGIDSITGGSGNSTFWWNTLGPDSSHMVNPSQTTIYEVTAVDTCLDDTAIGTVEVEKSFDSLRTQAYQDTTVCAGDPVQLGAEYVTGGTGDVEYFWEPDSITGNPVWTESDTLSENSNSTEGSSTYTLTVTDSCGVTDTSSMVVNYQNPEAAFHYTSVVKETNSPIHYFNDSRGGDHYFWDFGNEVTATTASDTVLSYKQPGTYEIMLEATDNLGCADTAWDEITIEPPFNFYVPNAFTPDGDGRNDEFRGKGDGVAEIHMQIFNRWGELVFETEELEKGWDGTENGKPASQGVYVYRIVVEGMNGETKELEGHVTLIR